MEITGVFVHSDSLLEPALIGGEGYVSDNPGIIQRSGSVGKNNEAILSEMGDCRFARIWIFQYEDVPKYNIFT
jgi:hypothetical protein